MSDPQPALPPGPALPRSEPPAVSQHDRAHEAPLPRTVRSADLLQGARELFIQHEEQTYRLRLTRNGKLILVK